MRLLRKQDWRKSGRSVFSAHMTSLVPEGEGQSLFARKGETKGGGGELPFLRLCMLRKFVCSQEKPALVLSVYLRKRKVTSPQSKPVVFDEDARYLHFERITNWKNENSTILFFIPPPLTNIKKAAAFFFFSAVVL